MPDFETIELAVEEPLARIVLGRPERLNALSPTMLAELAAAADLLDGDDRVRAVVVAGEGRAFCGGFDLAHWPREGSRATSGELAALGAAMARSVRRTRPVTVAALHGSVVGGGLVLALACDLRVAAEDTSFSIPEAELGIPLGWHGVELLAREVGPAIAKELVITCRPFTAAEAATWGMVNRVVPAAGLAAEVEDLARAVAARPRVVSEATKRHVEAVTRRSAGGGGDPSGGSGLVGAVGDPESARAATAYLAGFVRPPDGAAGTLHA
jgi:enoyl-CoA hydratase/carnithine racemase